MSLYDIHSKVLWVLTYHLKIDLRENISSTSFRKDLNLNIWEINLLLYYIEQALNFKFSKGVEHEIDSINQIVLKISKENLIKRELSKKRLSTAC